MRISHIEWTLALMLVAIAVMSAFAGEYPAKTLNTKQLTVKEYISLPTESRTLYVAGHLGAVQFFNTLEGNMVVMADGSPLSIKDVVYAVDETITKLSDEEKDKVYKDPVEFIIIMTLSKKCKLTPFVVEKQT